MVPCEKDINPACYIQKKAGDDPELPILTFENQGLADEVVTYGELVQKGNQLAGLLKYQGIGPGDVFATVMENRPEVIISLYAALATGAVLMPLDPKSNWEKLVYLLRHGQAKGVLFSSAVSENMDKVLSVLPGIKVLGITYLQNHRRVRKNDLQVILEAFKGAEIPPERKWADNYAMILYTSGTTGIPKGVKIRASRLYDYAAIAADIFKYLPKDRLYTGLPFTHGNAYSITIIPALFFGIPAVISRNIDIRRIWDICRRYECTIFSLLGGMAAEVHARPKHPDDAFNPVRKVISAGMPRNIWRAFEDRFNVVIHEWYGTLEGGFAHNPPGVGPVGSFGKPEGAYVEMKVEGKGGKPCEADEIGELMFRFRNQKNDFEYQSIPQADGNINENGWSRTGDMVHRDSDGWYFFDYRKDQDLRRYGEFIAAREVEGVLLAHPEVKEACVYGIAASSGAPGEHDLVAAIIPKTDITPDVSGIAAFCAAKLSAAAVPSYIQLVDAIPKTRTDKVVRRLLIEAFEAESPSVYCFNR